MDDISMNWMKEISRNETSLYLQLSDSSKLDEQMFERMANDDYCVSCVLRNKEKGIVMYSIKGYISLSDFLKQYVFEKEEIYLFLEHLFEQAIASNRNKPIILDIDYIFVSAYGDEFYFVALPLQIGEWMFQKDRLKEWIRDLCRHIQTKTAFECIGYLIKFCDAEEFSLPNLILGLKNIRKQYYSARFSFLKKKATTFRVKEPITSLYHSKHSNVEEHQTTILQSDNIQAYLDNGQDRFYLNQEQNYIGRSSENDIILSQKEISLKHALITKNQNRYYIQDLKSRNGTTIDEKKVQRKMRLRNGMKVQFANVAFTFHE